MSSTNYTVGFTIHDAKSLVTKGGNPVDPLVVVRCHGNEYSTEIKRGKTGVVSWDEACVWSDIVLNNQVAYIKAANAFWRNDVIGSCTLQLSMIHARRCHQVKRSLPLYLVNEPDVKGFLSLTVYVVGPKDTPPSPDDQDSDDEFNKNDDNIGLAVLDAISPEKVSNTGKPYHLYVSVHRVEHLPMTAKGERDPFLTCEFAGSKLKSARSTCNHSFNECFRIPVITPVQQDCVILKLWDWNFLATDELLACGRLSFAELRGRPVSIRWFNFYGFAKGQSYSTDVEGQEKRGSPNYYLGRLQLSARAERLDRIENLMPAQVVAAEPVEDVSTTSISLLSDVYEVSGVSAEEICVEVWCGILKRRTAWVHKESEKRNTNKNENSDDFNSGKDNIATSSVEQCFFFDQAMGRIDTLCLTVPTDERQQWIVFVSVYARGAPFTQEVRVAYHTSPLSSLPAYVDINPQTPCWIPLKMMPNMSSPNHSPVAVLMTLEKSLLETLARGKRKFLSFYEYELRCYIYAARHLPLLKGYLPNPAARVCCAGATGQTAVQKETNDPVFMECIRLNCRLSTDPCLNISTVAPITITILDVRHKKSSSHKNKQEKKRSPPLHYFLARTTCHYDRIRVNKKNNDVVEKLNPRWIEMHSGSNLDVRAGDVLVSFELVRKKNASKLLILPMRPELVHCTLTLSVASLRDLVMPKSQAGFFDWLLNQDAQTTMMPIKRPVILASVSVWESGVASPKTGILIPWNPTVPKDPLNKNKHWKISGQASYDFFASATLECFLPRNPIFDPRLTVLVYDRKIKPKYFIGTFFFDLVTLLPWITNMDAARQSLMAHKDFTESVNLGKIGYVLQNAKECDITRKKGLINLGVDLLKAADERIILEKSSDTKDALTQFSFKSQYISPSGVPKILIESYDSIQKCKLPIQAIDLNMFTLNVFIPARFVLVSHGVVAEKRKMDEFFRPSVEGCLEDFLSDLVWEQMSLSKKIGKKVVTVGMLQAGISLRSGGVSRSNISNDLSQILQDERKFRQRFRGTKELPSLIRLRIYIMQAIALTPLNLIRNINPFIVFKIGSNTENLRGNAKTNTANPKFCLFQEYDITLPEQTRLEIAVWSKQQSMSGSDLFIGSTILDLETRWFSKEWQRLITGSKVPIEYRPLYSQGDFVGTRSCGTLEMWIEMMTPQRAAEIPRVVLKEPVPSSVEIRVIIWGARALSFKHLKKDHVDAQVSVTLDCSNYKGSQPTTQSTDVHYHSRNGNAVFNWRVVYSSLILPLSSCVLQLAVYDFRTISSSVFIGEVNMDLRSYIEKVGVNQASREYDAELPLINRTSKGGKETAGFVQVTIQLLPQQEASLRPVGLGRESPNQNPRLTTPLDGRKWEDFIRTISFGKDFSKIMRRARVVVTTVCLFALFIISFVYPGLFLQ